MPQSQINQRNTSMEELYICLMDRLSGLRLEQAREDLENLLEKRSGSTTKYQFEDGLHQYFIHQNESKLLEVSLYSIEENNCQIALGFDYVNIDPNEQNQLAIDLIAFIHEVKSIYKAK